LKIPYLLLIVELRRLSHTLQHDSPRVDVSESPEMLFSVRSGADHLYQEIPEENSSNTKHLYHGLDRVGVFVIPTTRPTYDQLRQHSSSPRPQQPLPVNRTYAEVIDDGISDNYHTLDIWLTRDYVQLFGVGPLRNIFTELVIMFDVYDMYHVWCRKCKIYQKARWLLPLSWVSKTVAIMFRSVCGFNAGGGVGSTDRDLCRVVTYTIGPIWVCSRW